MSASKKGLLISLLISAIFFLVGLFTLSDYGISWDEPIHFHRGQDYLHFFLTGEKEFITVSGKQSYYQSNSLPAAYFFENDSGHPPLNGILAALTNYIFYQQLGIMGDIESHHLFNILVSSLLVFIVTLFAFETFGTFAAIVAGLSLSLYPLFFAESRFNIKDPAEAAFFGLTIYAFWKAVNNRSWKWMLLTALGFGFGLGTKFNILFLPFILVPWAIYKLLFLDRGKFQPDKKFILTFFISPLIILIIFIGTWPYLWSNPVGNFMEIMGYYKQIGTGYNYQTSQYYLPLGINSYPLLWILYTTPPYILFLSLVGIIVALFNFQRKDGACVLWLLWLVVPILRVILPDTSIYGGTRQIMEYIPAMALSAGLGANYLKNLVKEKFPVINHKLVALVFLLGFLQISLVLAKLHPNQNVYFNSLIGGLPGAKAANLPSWGNSFGNAYYPMLLWLNNNAETNATFGLIQGTALNIPRYLLRKDIGFNNLSWSAINRKGEYMMELTHENPVKAYPYAWNYIEKTLDPVYEVKADGVAIAKLWKNDLAHTKKEFQKSEIVINPLSITQDEKTILISLPDQVNLTRVIVSYQTDNCVKPKGSVLISADGLSYGSQPEQYPEEFVTEVDKQPDTIYYYFPLNEAKFIKFVDESAGSCLFNGPKITVKGIK